MKPHPDRPVALITGAGRRVGAVIARTLHAAGYDLALHYRHSGNEARLLADDLEQRRACSTLLLQAELAEKTVESAVGGGMIRVDVTSRHNSLTGFIPYMTKDLTRFAVLRREREQGKLRIDLDPQFAAVALLSLCVFPFVSLPITGPVLGFRPDGDELDRFISHTAQLFREGVTARTGTGHE